MWIRLFCCVRSQRGKCYVSVKFAPAAQRKKIVIYVECSKDQRSNSQSADFPDLRFLNFADAENLRVCGLPVAAMQLVSPNRSLNPATKHLIQIVPSLRRVRTIETRIKRKFDATILGVVEYPKSMLTFRRSCAACGTPKRAAHRISDRISTASRPTQLKRYMKSPTRLHARIGAT